jgi:hypothetical protein
VSVGLGSPEALQVKFRCLLGVTITDCGGTLIRFGGAESRMRILHYMSLLNANHVRIFMRSEGSWNTDSQQFHKEEKKNKTKKQPRLNNVEGLMGSKPPSDNGISNVNAYNYKQPLKI